ncbi:hypothetical protein [Streptomyces virginiae]
MLPRTGALVEVAGPAQPYVLLDAAAGDVGEYEARMDRHAWFAA